VLAHHFTQAGLTDAAIEWWGQAGDQALRRSAFQEAISHLGKAIGLADRLEDATQPTTPAPGSTGKRLKLQTSYGQATAHFRGFASDETKAAFAKAQQLLTKIDDPIERFVTYYGLWLSSVSRGDLASARSTAETCWRDAESASRVTEAAFALTLLGFTCLYQGDFGNALSHLQGAIRIYNPQRDHEAKFRRFGLDAGAWSALCLANAYWLVGEVEKARDVLNDARRRAFDAGHAVVLALHYDFEAMFETLRGDAEAVRQAAQLCINVSREHGLTVYRSEGIGYLGWALVQLGDRKTGIVQLNECISIHAEQGNRLFIPFFQGLLAEIEAQEENGAPAALARIDSATALATEMGGTLVRCVLASDSRQNIAEVQSGGHRASRASLPHRRRHRATAESAELRTASCVVAGEALSVNRPPGRRACGACAGSGGLFADAGISGDRTSSGAACGARGNG
jgi:tetratricopeptide (TPR) repeat protein